MGPEGGDVLHWVEATIIGLQRQEAKVERDRFVLDFLNEGGRY